MRLLPRFLQEIIASLRTLGGLLFGSVKGNAGIAALSLGLAFVLWIFVTETDAGPTRSGTLPGVEVPVQAVNVPRGLAIGDELPSVKVRVEVSQDVWNELTADDFEASVVLSNLSEGTHKVPIKVDAKTSRGGLRVLESSPSELDVLLVPLFSKTVPVSVQLNGAPPRGYSVGAVTTDPTSVLVSGRQGLVDLVNSVVVPIDLSRETSDINARFAVEARDEKGLLVRGVSIDRSEVNVSVAVDKQEFSLSLPVSPSVAGSPAPGYNVVSVTVSPPAVTVLGRDDLLNALSFIRTGPVDISGLADTVAKMVPLEVPSGASVAGSGQVLVRVEIKPVTGQLSYSIEPGFINLGSGLQLSGFLPPVLVTLQGPLPQLNSLEIRLIKVSVNLAGLGAGAHTVSIDVVPPSGTQLIGVSPAQLDVTIQQS
ncbi:MAG TPA: CdaR family protein [Dehalococcoidia bacterium]|nr:CdaR family protein [Dehalococcoidia bacterium]